MKSDQIDDVLRNLRQGKKCYGGFDDRELSTVIAIEQDDHNLFRYTWSTGHRYDVVSPAHYGHQQLNESELRTLLEELPEEVSRSISYIANEVVNEATHDKVNLIYSYLKQRPRVVYLVLKADRRKTSEGQSPMNFHSIFHAREQAEKMIDYLRNQQGSECSLKEVTLSFGADEIELHGELSELDRVSSKQILISLLSMETNRVVDFFYRVQSRR